MEFDVNVASVVVKKALVGHIALMGYDEDYQDPEWYQRLTIPVGTKGMIVQNPALGMSNYFWFIPDDKSLLKRLDKEKGIWGISTKLDSFESSQGGLPNLSEGGLIDIYIDKDRKSDYWTQFIDEDLERMFEDERFDPESLVGLERG